MICFLKWDIVIFVFVDVKALLCWTSALCLILFISHNPISGSSFPLFHGGFSSNFPTVGFKMIEKCFRNLVRRFVLVKKCFYFFEFWRYKSFACGGRCFFGRIGRLQIVLTRSFGRMQFVLTKRRFYIFILGWMGGRTLFFPFFCFILFLIVYYMFIKVYYMFSIV